MKYMKPIHASLIAAVVDFVACISEARTTYGSSLSSPTSKSRRYHFSRDPLSLTLFGDNGGGRATDPFDLVSGIFSMPIYMNSLMRQRDAEWSRLTRLASPRYAVSEDTESGELELTVEVPGVTSKDMTIELEDDKLLRIRGTRFYKQHGGTYWSDFNQLFQLDENVDTSQLKVSLSAGVLRVTVPKKQNVIKKISITALDEEPEDIQVGTKLLTEVGVENKENQKEEEKCVSQKVGAKEKSSPVNDEITICEDECGN